MNIIKEAGVGTVAGVSPEDLALIHAQSRKELTAEEVFTFCVKLCDNEVDRDYERFPEATLRQLSPLFVGKSGIFDHRWSAREQVGRIYRTELVREEEIGRRMGKDDHSFCKYVVHKRIEKIPQMVDLNIFGIFGKYEDWEIRFISNAICKTLFDLPVTLRQNRRFSYLYVDDLMPVLDYFIEHPAQFSSYNVTPEGETELLQAAQTVLRVSGKNLPITVGKEGYGLNYSGNNERLKAEIPGLTFTPFETAVQQLYRWYAEHQNQLDRNKLLSDK